MRTSHPTEVEQTIAGDALQKGTHQGEWQDDKSQKERLKNKNLDEIL